MYANTTSNIKTKCVYCSVLYCDNDCFLKKIHLEIDKKNYF
jgi:hypothetical protein